MTVLEISDSVKIADAIDTDGVVVVDFGAEAWCAPCRALHKHYDAASDQLSDVVLIRADIDDNPNLAAEYGIQGVPTLLAFKDGTLYGSITARTAIALVNEISGI